MEINELYLKTAFCCMACDGDIASEELALIKEYTSNSGLFLNLDIESKLNEYVTGINRQGILFLNSYLKEITSYPLTEVQELNIVRIAIQMIEADNKIEYSEISFFKRYVSICLYRMRQFLQKCPIKRIICCLILSKKNMSLCRIPYFQL